MSEAVKIACQLDDVEVHHMASYLAEKHEMSVADYLKKFPKAHLVSAALQARYAAQTQHLTRQHPQNREDLTINRLGYELPVNWDVPEEACLPLPASYRYPQYGELHGQVRRFLRYFKKLRNVWIWGGAGGGKDALISALCFETRSPSILFQINPGINIMNWLYEKQFKDMASVWHFGELFKALVEGYISPISGRRIPMKIVLSDLDRANASQVEALRLIADSIQGRVKGPNGETYKVLPGTQILVTANTMGSGDATGRYVSAQVLDMSIIDRLSRKLHFDAMDWKDERAILREKYPTFAQYVENQHASDVWETIGNAVKAIRAAIDNHKIFGICSHRSLETWIEDCQDILDLTEDPLSPSNNLLKQGFYSYADGLPDLANRQAVLTAAGAHISGLLNSGDTSGVQAGDVGFE